MMQILVLIVLLISITLTMNLEPSASNITIIQMKRFVHIPVCGTIVIKENVNLLHTGTTLEAFLRTTNYVDELYYYEEPTQVVYHTIALPPSACNVRYEDKMGNILSKRIVHYQEYVLLKLGLRGPLFGEWKTSYSIFYDLKKYPYHSTFDNEYELGIRFIDHAFDKLHVDKLEVFISLPIRTSNVRLVLPHNVTWLPDGISYEYLDYVGRTVFGFWFRKSDLVEDHIDAMTIILYGRATDIKFYDRTLIIWAFCVLCVLMFYNLCTL